MADPPRDVMLGRLAVHLGIITLEQLVQLTSEQSRRGGVPLGRLMLELGMASDSDLKRLLREQADMAARRQPGAAAAGPAPVAMSADALGLEAVPAGPAAAPMGRMPPPKDDRNLKTIPVLPDRPAPPPPPPPVAAAPAPPPPPPAVEAPAEPPPESLAAVLDAAAGAGASDLHVHAGARLRMRRAGRFGDIHRAVLTAEDTERYLRQVMTPDQLEQMEAIGELDFSFNTPAGARFRVNAYKQARGKDIAFRAIPATPPSLEQLGLPPELSKLGNYHQGLVLITGPAGSGKTSTLAALVNLINEDRSDHILTIEDPIEVKHASKKCVVNQRQVKRHTETFARALRAALREDPDVIVIGEMRDLETISLALSAAETGHLVLATLHTNSAIRTINRLVGVFPPSQQPQVRSMVSESLRAIVSQRLVRTADGTRRVPALEVMYANRAVSNLIRENRALQLRSVLQTGSASGMYLMEQSLADLVARGIVTQEEANKHLELQPAKDKADPAAQNGTPAAGAQAGGAPPAGARPGLAQPPPAGANAGMARAPVRR